MLTIEHWIFKDFQGLFSHFPGISRSFKCPWKYLFNSSTFQGFKDLHGPCSNYHIHGMICYTTLCTISYLTSHVYCMTSHNSTIDIMKFDGFGWNVVKSTHKSSYKINYFNLYLFFIFTYLLMKHDILCFRILFTLSFIFS